VNSDISAEVLFRRPHGRLAAIHLLFHYSRATLAATAWVSASLFGLYILAFYAGALADRTMMRWNENLPGLYEPGTLVTTSGIAMHFAAGGIILILGCFQLIPGVRSRVPALHRWIGRVYVSASILAGLGGLTFIIARGTIGGPVMDLGFAGYGILTVLCAVQTYRYARARQLSQHRAWALRLFALAIGSWLYRMDYGFWLLLAHGAGHVPTFRGWFDHIMAFFFYVPNLLLVELLLRSSHKEAWFGARLAASAAFVVATGFLLLGTYYFTKFYWGPAILHRITG
jgi:Predicted membrane protein (DUF2306)